MKLPPVIVDGRVLSEEEFECFVGVVMYDKKCVCGIHKPKKRKPAKLKPPKTIEAGLRRLGHDHRLCWHSSAWKIWYFRDDVDRMDYHTGGTALSAVRNACREMNV